MTLDSDGTVSQDEKVIGKVAENTMVLEQGAWRATVHPDDSIEIPHLAKTFRFLQDGAIESVDGPSISLDAQGRVTLRDAMQGATPMQQGQFDGVTTETRRTAALLFLAQHVRQSAASRSLAPQARAVPSNANTGKKAKKNGAKKEAGKKSKKG